MTKIDCSYTDEIVCPYCGDESNYLMPLCLDCCSDHVEDEVKILIFKIAKQVRNENA